MKPTKILAALAAAFAFAPFTFVLPAAAAGADDATVSVMIVGNFHMGNPGHDLHNAHIDDMLLPKYQTQIAAVIDALARFHPSAVAAEWDADTTRDRYRKYLAGTLEPSRNEVVQLGFRLAKAAKLSTVYGVDVDGDFPYDAVVAYAKAHGKSAILDKMGAEIEVHVQKEGAMVQTEGVAATLRYLNDPSNIAHGNDFYRQTLRVGSGTEQPGADLLTAWYRRNFLICANIIQLSKPGDHIVVFYGSGHSFLLRQCIQETPGFKLVEPNDYLPR